MTFEVPARADSCWGVHAWRNDTFHKAVIHYGLTHERVFEITQVSKVTLRHWFGVRPTLVSPGPNTLALILTTLKLEEVERQRDDRMLASLFTPTPKGSGQYDDLYASVS